MITFQQIAKTVLDPRYKRIGIKIGSKPLKTDYGDISRDKINLIARQTARLMNDHDKEIIMVSSGAIAKGEEMIKIEIPDLSWLIDDMGYKGFDPATHIKQSYAAIGQANLIHMYQEAFSRYDIRSKRAVIGQALLTRPDFDIDEHLFNLRATLETLIHNRVVPILNENDTIRIEEITVGDNDMLMAYVARYAKVDAIIMLSSIDGIMNYSNQPIAQNGTITQPGEIIPIITDVEHVISMGGITKAVSDEGRGGAMSKANAASYLKDTGIPVFLINGLVDNCIEKALEGNLEGTVFATPEFYSRFK